MSSASNEDLASPSIAISDLGASQSQNSEGNALRPSRGPLLSMGNESSVSQGLLASPVRRNGRSRRSKKRGGKREKRLKAMAEEIVGDPHALRARLKDELFCLAAAYVGVSLSDLEARPIESFRKTMGTPRESLERRAGFYDRERVEMVSMILGRMETAASIQRRLAEEEEETKRRVAEDLLARTREERERQKAGDAATLRRRAVVDRENRAMRESRRREKQLRALEEEREAKLARKRERMDKMRQEKAKATEDALVNARLKREKREEARLEAIKQAHERRERRLAKRREEMDREKEEERKRAEERKAKRIKARKRAMGGEEKKRLAEEKKLREAEERRRELEEMRQEELRRKRDERWAAEEHARLSKERAQRAMAFQTKLKAQRTARAFERTEVLQDLQSVLSRERSERHKRAITEDHRWRASTPLERTVTPGPGHYVSERPSTSSASLGWRAAPSKRMQELRSRKSWVDETPPPGAYGVPDDSLTRNGSFTNAARFSTANPKSFLDLAADKSKTSPAPHDYTPKSIVSERTAKISPFRPRNFAEEEIHRNRDKPGPGGMLLDQALALPKEASKSRSKISMASFTETAPSSSNSAVKGRARTSPARSRSQSAERPVRPPSLRDLERSLSRSILETDYTRQTITTFNSKDLDDE